MRPKRGRDLPEDGPILKTEEDQSQDHNHNEDQDGNTNTNLVPYEIERNKIIQRNRERLLELGLPALANKFKSIVKPEPKPKKKRAPKAKKIKKEEQEHETEDVKDVLGQSDAGIRRSTRLRTAATKPKPETAEEKFTRELGEFIVDGECPKCHKFFEKRHKQHLSSCTGIKKQASSTSGYSQMDKELLAELTEEEKKDERKRTLARMKAVSMANIVEYSSDDAQFIVIGSKGDPYTVTLADEKHKCTCMDYRFRRHHCKHICLVLSELGILDNPTAWHDAVGNKLDALVKLGENNDSGEDGPAIAPPIHDKDAEVAMKFI